VADRLTTARKATQATAPHTRMDVALIGYQDQGNLGMGYLASNLQEHGWTVEMIDVREGPDAIADRFKDGQPLVIGFSLIFQFFLPQFRRVARHLREVGITSHFTIGGHYPSLCHDEVLELFPELDSVVRYEGEQTLLEIVQHLAAGDDWRGTPGIVYTQDGRIVESELRHLTVDLDSLPFPYRPFEPEHIMGFPTLPLLASRGCAHRCSFCSIHMFYRTAPGKVVRVRTPARVVQEMLELYEQQNVRVFLFQDDDFPVWDTPIARRWVDELLERMHSTGLADHVLWKISCRAQYVEPELFKRLHDAGLFIVYMGIESGTESGLEVLNKRLSVEQNLRAVRILKELDIRCSYGFMLLDPSSTFESVRSNASFLRSITGDGSTAARFCRMLPYGGTPIREQLRMEGRLRGDYMHPDYVFWDTRLNHYWDMLSRAARFWVDDQGLASDFNWAWEEFDVVRRLVGDLPGAVEYGTRLRALTAFSNEQLVSLVERSSLAFERNGADKYAEFNSEVNHGVAEKIRAELMDLRNTFVARNVDVLMAATEHTPVLVGSS
jgi:anaerobic magnesium-protoporphyrin IX monomethyl ester cyclase